MAGAAWGKGGGGRWAHPPPQGPPSLSCALASEAHLSMEGALGLPEPSLLVLIPFEIFPSHPVRQQTCCTTGNNFREVKWWIRGCHDGHPEHCSFPARPAWAPVVPSASLFRAPRDSGAESETAESCMGRCRTGSLSLSFVLIASHTLLSLEELWEVRSPFRVCG